MVELEPVEAVEVTLVVDNYVDIQMAGAGKTTTIRLLLDFYGRLRGGVDAGWVVFRRRDLR